MEGEYELVKQALTDAMVSSKRVWLTCPKCSKRSEVEVPDHGARMKAVELWITEGLGKAGTSPAGPPVPSAAELVGLRLEEMTNEQLEAIVAAGESGS